MTNSSYHALDAAAVLLPSGHVGVAWCYLEASFTPKWSNPLWKWGHVAASTEGKQVMRALEELAVASGHPWGGLNSTMSSFDAVPIVALSPLQRARIWSLRLWSAVVVLLRVN